MTTTSYSIGIDLGTTFTAAAVHREGAASICHLGSRAAPIPSVVFLRDDQTVLTGEAAERRGRTEPTHLAREFKRRVGDSVPIMLGQAPYSAERLMAALLDQVVAAVATREGSAPAQVAVSHPANWGPFKIDLLSHALDLAGLRSVTLLSEPVAAAVHYASTNRVDAGSVVAVYDLGGGTFDAAVLEKTETAFVTLGEPEGIERLGGIDFDEAIVAHVRAELSSQLDGLDANDPAVRVGLERVRRECVAAKEALSYDSDTTIPVALPGIHTDIRITRSEFEPMIKAAIGETIGALHRAIERAGVRADDLDAVVLVGGSSQIPLVSELVSNALGRPVAVDAHPKHSVALGAAVVAARAAVAAAPASAPASVTSHPRRTDQPDARVPDGPAISMPPPEPPTAPAEVAPSLPITDTSASALGAPGRRGRLLRRVGVAAAVAALLGVATAGAYALGSDGGGDPEGAGTAASALSSEPASPDSATPTTAAAVACPSPSGRCARIVDIRRDGDQYVASYEVESFDPVIFREGVQGTPDDHHVHFFFDTTAPEDAGTNSSTPGQWTVWDRAEGGGELRFDADTVADAGGARELCVLVADAAHGVEAESGNCVGLPA